MAKDNIMRKIYFLIIIIFLLMACKQYPAVTPPKPEYSLILDNNINGINLYEINKQIFISNISTQLIIELDYSINNDNIILYDILVPNENIIIYNWITGDIKIIINNVEFY